MAHMLIRHKVADFAKWKKAFEAHRSYRETAGLTDQHLWRNGDDPDEVVILFKVSDLAKAKAFSASPELKEKMETAGVEGAPHIAFLADA